jgi:DNA-binding NtrC family response regulator
MYAPKSRRILVVEDDALLAWELQDILSGHGYEVLGPISRLPILMRHLQKILPDAASEPAIDAALLDVTIDGGLVFPAADMLARANVPFAFVSGHDRQMLPMAHRQRPLLNKPIYPADILGTVDGLIEAMETADRSRSECRRDQAARPQELTAGKTAAVHRSRRQ